MLTVSKPSIGNEELEEVKKVFDTLLEENNPYWKGISEPKRANGIVICGNALRDFNIVADKEVEFTRFTVEFMQSMGE